MPNWHDNVLRLIAEIDRCIRAREGETLTLAHLARLLDCSQSQVSHQFHALTGTSLRDFVQARRPALALPAVRDGEQRQLAPEAEQRMAFVNEPSGRICSWGIPLAECWGVRLPRDCTDAVPAPLQLMEVPEGDYLVFEHGPFDLQTENGLVEAKIERAMRDFDYEAAGCCLDTAPGRVFYFVHDCVRFWKYIRPVVRF